MSAQPKWLMPGWAGLSRKKPPPGAPFCRSSSMDGRGRPEPAQQSETNFKKQKRKRKKNKEEKNRKTEQLLAQRRRLLQLRNAKGGYTPVYHAARQTNTHKEKERKEGETCSALVFKAARQAPHTATTKKGEDQEAGRRGRLGRSSRLGEGGRRGVGSS